MTSGEATTERNEVEVAHERSLASAGEDSTIRLGDVASPASDPVVRSGDRFSFLAIALQEWRQFVGAEMPYEPTCAHLPPDDPPVPDRGEAAAMRKIAGEPGSSRGLGQARPRLGSAPTTQTAPQ